jgi:hypothetical protein
VRLDGRDFLKFPDAKPARLFRAEKRPVSAPKKPIFGLR